MNLFTYSDEYHGTFALDPTSGMIYPLTDCCRASGKGSALSATGIICRECYADVPSRFGMCAVLDTPTLYADLKSLLPECAAQDKNECAYSVLWGLEEAGEPDREMED